jgi:hypothetical protein
MVDGHRVVEARQMLDVTELATVICPIFMGMGQNKTGSHKQKDH